MFTQHSDNSLALPCVWCQAFMPWHFQVQVMWDDVKYGGAGAGAPGDNLYGAQGAFDDCPHCTVYSGPAAIQMIVNYKSPGVFPPQDLIYDSSELQAATGEIVGDMIIQRHGFGMTDASGGTTPPEIQNAFLTFIGGPMQHNQWDASALGASTLESYVLFGYPVLWDDHGGWPVNMDPTWPSGDRTEQGHYKVIAGYDDSNTAGVYGDDLALIFDPWPEYTDQSVLPVGAVNGPGNSFDPYWLPVPAVLGDPNDLFLVDIAAIPEFAGLLVPVVGAMMVAVLALRTSIRRKGSQ